MTRNEFYTKWLEVFASDIPEREIEKHVRAIGNHIWHVFSWELLDESRYLTGEDARRAYDKIDKRGARYIEWFEDDHTTDLTWDLNSAKALDKFVEVYVVGKDFNWTYIKTHENDICGPYFMKLK